MKFSILFASLILSTSQLLGHAGCYEAPGAHSAPHGGLLEHTDNILVELVDTQNPMEVYVLDGDMQPIATQNITLRASVRLPKRSKGSANVQVESRNDHFLAQVTTKGRLHRYTLVLKVEQSGQSDIVEFEVEL